MLAGSNPVFWSFVVVPFCLSTPSGQSVLIRVIIISCFCDMIRNIFSGKVQFSSTSLLTRYKLSCFDQRGSAHQIKERDNIVVTFLLKSPSLIGSWSVNPTFRSGLLQQLFQLWAFAAHTQSSHCLQLLTLLRTDRLLDCYQWKHVCISCDCRHLFVFLLAPSFFWTGEWVHCHFLMS